MWDARAPLHFGRFTIHDDHRLGRFINMKEVFTYHRISARRGSRCARRRGAQGVPAQDGPDGSPAHRAAGKRLADPAAQVGRVNTVTIAFGHGIAVAPLQAVMGIDALVNGGYLIPPTFLKRSEEDAMKVAKRVIKKETSDKMRFLLRLNAEIGTAKKADVKGYYVGGKTGTAEKVINGRYAKKRVLNAFTAILPADNPQYQLLVMLDEPQPLKETHRLHYIRLERGADRRQGHRTHCAASRRAAAVRFAAVRAPHSCGIRVRRIGRRPFRCPELEVRLIFSAPRSELRTSKAHQQLDICQWFFDILTFARNSLK